MFIVPTALRPARRHSHRCASRPVRNALAMRTAKHPKALLVKPNCPNDKTRPQWLRPNANDEGVSRQDAKTPRLWKMRAARWWWTIATPELREADLAHRGGCR